MAKICTNCHIEKEFILFRVRKNKNNTSAIYYRSDCIECEKNYNKYRKLKNKDKLSAKRKQYYLKNKDIENENSRAYYGNNKQKIIKRAIANQSIRLKIDPVFKLRQAVSGSIRDSLSGRLSSKNNLSVWKFLPYTKYELKKHFENQFEPWMNWNNWGRYNVQTWNDNDSSTWTWNIDHIISHSNFPYISMADQEFKDCWVLTNLRPYSAKQNIIDGCRLK